ncbi:MAG: polysaccharide biosynthesis/export family protein [Candidatus Brocadiales bacterium]
MTKRKKLICSLVVISCLVGGCTNHTEIKTRMLTYRDRENRLEVINGTYRMGAADEIVITIMDNPDLTKKARIRTDGNITVGLIGDVYIENMTPIEAGDKLHKLFQQYLRDLPREAVGVEVVGFYSKRIYIFSYGRGERQIPFTGDTTVLDAISASGLLGLTSAPKKIMIIRGEPDPEKLPKMLKVNLFDIVVKGRNDKNIPLRENDIVYIPANFFGRMGFRTQLLFFPITSLLGIAYAGAMGAFVASEGPTALVGFGGGGLGGGGIGAP